MNNFFNTLPLQNRCRCLQLCNNKTVIYIFPCYAYVYIHPCYAYVYIYPCYAYVYIHPCYAYVYIYTPVMHMSIYTPAMHVSISTPVCLIYQINAELTIRLDYNWPHNLIADILRPIKYKIWIAEPFVLLQS